MSVFFFFNTPGARLSIDQCVTHWSSCLFACGLNPFLGPPQCLGYICPDHRAIFWSAILDIVHVGDHGHV